MFFTQLGSFFGCVLCASCATLPTHATWPTPTPATSPAPHCESKGVHYKPGETLPDFGPCIHCTCTQSGPKCVFQDCMFPICANPVRVPDQCCSVCPYEPKPTCKHTDGTVIQHGEQYKPNPYTTCECSPFQQMAICVAQAQTNKPLTHIDPQSQK